VKININGREVNAFHGDTIVTAAKRAGMDIPTLCYDERVKLYGACGICVVEAEGMPKLLRACSTMVSPGMIIKTDTQRVIAARKTALELLMSDHEGDCRPPCVQTCPANTDCQGYVGLIANGQFKEAAALIREQLPLPASIGRVCPHPCEEACRRQLVEEPINIAMLKAFAGDIDLSGGELSLPERAAPTGKKVAIIGGGPAGLTAGYFLALKGVEATIYDAMPKMGGMLRYGIPEYRLPKSIVDKEVEFIEKTGAKMVNNVKIGRDITLDSLRGENDAVITAIGAWSSIKMRVPGEDANGVIGGIDFLRKAALNEPVYIGKKVAVCGGGNTAMDACRTAVRLGAEEVYLVYRRTKAEMPAEAIEIKEAEEEGVIFKYLTNPIEITAKDGRVSEMRLQLMELGEPDDSGRRRPVPIEGKEEMIGLDTVIMAIGQGADPIGLEEIELTRRNTISADEATFLTNLEGVFAIGDATNKGADIAISAIGEGKKASEVIYSYLEGNIIPFKQKIIVERTDVTAEEFADKEKQARLNPSHLSPEYRKTNFNEILKGYSPEAAVKEASRCLECGCADYFECSLLRLANDYDAKPQTLAGEVKNKPKDFDHPFITRNQNKCILCGLCVRVCDEVMGISAYGFLDRGFDTTVIPELNKPLCETGCISCGQCVSMCPTGALTEIQPIVKNVPLREKATKTVCGFCGVGCKTVITSNGDQMLRSVYPEDEKSYLCVNGKFGFGEMQKDRLLHPMVRKDGELIAVSLSEALLTITKKTQAISANAGSGNVHVSISDRLTIEEAYLIKKYAEEVIKTPRTGSFNGFTGGLSDVFGIDASMNTMDELDYTNLIITVGGIMKSHPVAGLHVRNAVQNGAGLVTINDTDSVLTAQAEMNMEDADLAGLLQALVKAVWEAKGEPENVAGLDTFKNAIRDVSVTEEIKILAEKYTSAKKAMILFDRASVSNKSAALIGMLAVLSGHIGKPREGIIQLKPAVNSQGLALLDINGKGISDKNRKGLIVFGEDIKDFDRNGLSMLAVFDTHLTETAKKADVVIPLSAFSETDGTVISSDRKIQTARKVVPSKTGLENWQLIQLLANTSDKVFHYNALADIQKEISGKVSGFRDYCKPDAHSWPVYANPVLSGSDFREDQRIANLDFTNICDEDKDISNTSSIQNRFTAYLLEKGLVNCIK